MPCCNVSTKNTRHCKFSCERGDSICIPTGRKSCICLRENERGDIVSCDNCICINKGSIKTSCILTNSNNCCSNASNKWNKHCCSPRDRSETDAKNCGKGCIAVKRNPCICISKAVDDTTACTQFQNITKASSNYECDDFGRRCEGCTSCGDCIPKNGSCVCNTTEDKIVKCNSCKCGSSSDDGVSAKRDKAGCICVPTDGISCIYVCKDDVGNIKTCNDCKCDQTGSRTCNCDKYNCISTESKTKCCCVSSKNMGVERCRECCCIQKKNAEEKKREKKCNKAGCTCIPTNGEAYICVCNKYAMRVSSDTDGAITRSSDCCCVKNKHDGEDQSEKKCDKAGCICIPTNGKTCICVCKDDDGQIITCNNCKCDHPGSCSCNCFSSKD